MGVDVRMMVLGWPMRTWGPGVGVQSADGDIAKVELPVGGKLGSETGRRKRRQGGKHRLFLMRLWLLLSTPPHMFHERFRTFSN